MCDLTMIFTIGASLLGAYSQIEQGRAQQQAANYNAQVAQMNAKLADERARDALERGAEEENKKRREVAGLIGKNRAAMAKSAVDMSFGSPLDVIIDSATLGELDALTIKKNSYREEQDHRQQANNYRAEAGMYKAAGKNAKSQSLFAAGGTLLGGVGDAYKGFKMRSV